MSHNKKEGFIHNMLSKNGKVSSKRFVTFTCLFFMMVGYVANLFWDFSVQDSMYESLQWIVMAGLGFTASENFAPNPTPIDNKEEFPSDSV